MASDYKKCGVEVTGAGNSTRLCPHQLSEREKAQASDGDEDVWEADPSTMSNAGLVDSAFCEGWGVREMASCPNRMNAVRAELLRRLEKFAP